MSSTQKDILTKSFCLTYAKSRYKISLIATAVIWSIIVLLLFIAADLPGLIIGSLALLYEIISVIHFARCLIKLDRGEYYLVSDTAVSTKRKLSVNRRRPSHAYRFVFRKYGIYTIKTALGPSGDSLPSSSPAKNGIDYAKVECDAITRFEAGETFYLLLLDMGKKPKTLQIFNTFFYDISSEDFEETNGRFIPNQ